MSKTTIRFGLIAAACAGAPLLLSACADGGMMGMHRVPAFDRAEEPCKDTSFPIYFDKGSDQLTADAHALIQTVGGRVKSCRVRSAEVVGLADAGGPSDQGNAALALRRADSVARALSDAGLPVPVKEASAGTSGAVTPSGKAEPLRRRTEVILHIVPGAGRA